MLLGLGHIARTGKDECAAVLVADGWQQLAFADALRELALVANPYIASLVESGGWEGAKAHRQVNHIMEDLGSTVRKQFGPDALIEAVMRQMDPERNVVISDCRYPSEILAVRDAGGFVVRVDRPGVGPTRPSDRHLASWDGWDARISNDGTLAHLGDSVRRAVAHLSAIQ